MLTIAGNGMGNYTFANIKLQLDKYDKIICDKNFIEFGNNILKVGFKEAKEYILTYYKEENILYVVTGSPYFFSAGILIAKQIERDYVKIIDNISSKKYIQNKFFLNDSEIDVISLHGRADIDLTKFLINKYTFVLCDKDSINKIQRTIKYLDFKDIEIVIGYKLGYEDEIIEQIDLLHYNYNSFDLSKPYVLLIKKLFTNISSNDEQFITERGMITKKYKRDLSLQNLDLQPNQLLWDIGAGSGSCAIEAYKRYKVKTILFENQPQRVDNIKLNLYNHKVIDTLLLEGNAEDLFDTLNEDPSRIFVGGGGVKVINRLPYLYERLKNNGVMLINAITLKHLNLMLNILNDNKIDYEIFSLGLTTYKGRLDLVEPQRQLFSIKIQK